MIGSLTISNIRTLCDPTTLRPYLLRLDVPLQPFILRLLHSNVTRQHHPLLTFSNPRSLRSCIFNLQDPYDPLRFYASYASTLLLHTLKMLYVWIPGDALTATVEQAHCLLVGIAGTTGWTFRDDAFGCGLWCGIVGSMLWERLQP